MNYEYTLSHAKDADQCAQEVISAWEAAGPDAAKILPEDCKALFEQAWLYKETKRVVAERLVSKMLTVSDNFRLECAEKFFMDAYQVHLGTMPTTRTANRATNTKITRRS